MRGAKDIVKVVRQNLGDNGMEKTPSIQVLCVQFLKLSLSLVQKRLSEKQEHNFSSFNLVLLILIKCLKQCY